MELGPIWRALSTNKLRFGIIAGQIALTLAMIANGATLIHQARETMSARTGLDEERLILGLLCVPKPALRNGVQRDVWMAENLDAIRLVPGVVSLTANDGVLWLPGSRGWYHIKPLDSTREPIEGHWFSADEFFPETLGLVVDEGRWFTADEAKQAQTLWASLDRKRERLANGNVREIVVGNVVITRALGRHLFGEGPLLGKMFEDRDGDIGRVIGVIQDFRVPEVASHFSDHVVFGPGPLNPNWGGRFYVRTEPGKSEEVSRRINEHVSSRYQTTCTAAFPLAAVRNAYFGAQRMISALMGLLVFLLLFVAFVGIAGLTSFSVTARTRQIGVRRALGATPNDILLHFLTETGIVTSLGLALGAVLSIPLNMGLLKFYDAAKLSPSILAGCALLLFLVALGSALPAARRASRISPAIATRNV